MSTGRGKTVAVLEVATNTITQTVEVGARPWGIALSRDGKRLYSANGPSGDVTVVDTAKLQVITHVTVGKSPWGVAVGPALGAAH